MNLSQDKQYLNYVSALNKEQQQFQDIMFKQIDNEVQGFENQIDFLMENEKFSSK